MSLTVGTDTYISLDDADTYFSNRLHADIWDDATDAEKEKALKMACDLLENRVIWAGQKTDSSQILQWPRKNLLNHYRDEVDSSTIPDSVKYVQCELAQYLLEVNPLTVPNGIKNIDLDGLQVDIQAIGETIPPKIFKPIQIYGQLIDSKATFRLSR